MCVGEGTDDIHAFLEFAEFQPVSSTSYHHMDEVSRKAVLDSASLEVKQNSFRIPRRYSFKLTTKYYAQW